MKRFLSGMLLCALWSPFAWAVPPQPSRTSVKARHQHVQRQHVQHHRAHKAGKHHRPKRHHREV